jgi:mono/diheme cytochrome c family protein
MCRVVRAALPLVPALLAQALLAPVAADMVSAGQLVPIPEEVAAFLREHCAACHDASQVTGGVDLDVDAIDWSRVESRTLWQRVLQVNNQQRMPPPAESQPTPDQREVLASWLDAKLLENTPLGGALPRRLSKAEYQATIRELLHLPEFEVPLGFPRDSQLHGFNNLAEGLALSPPLLEAYLEVAWEVADQLYPPPRAAVPSTVRTAGPEDMVISFSAASVRDNALRLASRCSTIMRSCTWPSRIEITTSGQYRITVEASTFRPASAAPMVLEVRAREIAASDRSRAEAFRLLQEIPVGSQSPQTFTFEAELYEGQTLLFRWLNAEMDHDSKPLAEQMRSWFEKDPRFLAAWQRAVFPLGVANGPRTTHLRGRNGWDIVKAHWQDPQLDLSQAGRESQGTQKLLQTFDSNQGTFNLADALCHYYFENGPALQLHSVTVEGPLEVVAGPGDKRRAQRQSQLAGIRGEGMSDEAYARQMLSRFLPRAFRRPVDAATVDSYLAIAREHWAAGHSLDEGLHLLLRSILVSPRFLYRALHAGKLDDYDLATRLAYFLTQGPPDEKLLDLACRGRLSAQGVLGREARRLLPHSPRNPFVQDFTRQWLDTGLLPEIMPDPKFNFTPYYIDIARDEVEYFFAEMIRENRPLTDFIDPDFTYTSPLFARHVYQLRIDVRDEQSQRDQRNQRELQRIDLPRGGRVGGLLGQSAIMMATANGVDTQPVLRGVWVLENLLGAPPPKPPANVPALTPDTRGSTTPRELLAAHTSDPDCAVCHQRIDPLGFALENHDPVGRWRDRWPGSNATIDASGEMPDGTRVRDVVDFKRWLVDHVDQFSQCLAEKLMTYATGRLPNHAERHEIAAIVRDNRGRGNGFRDLLIALITSETFRTR